MATRVAWNKDKTKSVVLAKLKEFTIADEEYKGYTGTTPHWSVKGWFNKENYFDFGNFSTEDEARMFLETVHKMF